MQFNQRNLVLLPQKALSKSVNTITRRIVPAISSVIGRFYNNAVPAYWWTGERNFGDLITPALLRAYGLTPVYCRDPKLACLVAVGSIIGRLLHFRIMTGLYLDQVYCRTTRICVIPTLELWHYAVN